MKEVSTAATKQSRNFSEQKLTIGLDLRDRSSYYCMLNEDGALMLEQKISTTAKALQAAFGTMPHSRIALETGMHSPWISRLLSELGHEVIVAQSKCWMPCSLNNATVALTAQNGAGPTWGRVGNLSQRGSRCQPSGKWRLAAAPPPICSFCP